MHDIYIITIISSILFNMYDSYIANLSALPLNHLCLELHIVL